MQIDSPREVVLVDDLVQVVENLVRIGDRVVRSPRLELIAEGMQIRVRPDAGIAEQVPGAADRVATVHDREALTGLQGSQVMTHPEAGDAGTDDQHIDVATQRLARAGLVEGAHSHRGHSLIVPGNCNVNSVIVFLRFGVKGSRGGLAMTTVNIPRRALFRPAAGRPLPESWTPPRPSPTSRALTPSPPARSPTAPECRIPRCTGSSPTATPFSTS